MRNQPQLIAYVDRFSGGGFREFQSLLQGPLKGAFGGVHLLPFFYPIDGADAGFDPIDHTKVDPRLGAWEDVRALGEHVEIMADLIVNHISSRSPQFLDYDKRGDASPFAGMFLTYTSVFGDGAREADLLQLYRPRPGLPFTNYQLRHGEQRLLWTTFTGEQIDIDVHHIEGKRYLETILNRFHASGIRAIRLDAVGYAIKKAGTSGFMIPETFEFIAELTSQAHTLGIEVLVEIHSHYLEQIEIAKQVDWVFDFALPPLVLHTLYTRNARQLKRWFEIRPPNAVTVLDTHDGIGVLDVGADRKGGNLPGLLTPEEIDQLVHHLGQAGRPAVQVLDPGEAEEVVGHVDEALALALEAPDALQGAALALRLRVGEVLAEQLQVEAERAEVVLDLVDETAGQLGEGGIVVAGHGCLRARSCAYV